MTPYNGDRYGPVLTADKDRICEGVLKDVRAHFLTSKPWQTYPSLNIHFYSLAPLDKDDLVEEPGTPDSNRVMMVDGKRLYVAVRFYNGYGGAADTQGLQVSDQPIPYNADIKSTTVAGAGWSLFKDKDGRFFAAGIEQGKLFHLYRITADEGLELACTATFTPSDAVLNADDAWKTAFTSIRLLKQTRDRIAGGEGSTCGSMRTQSRWSRSVDEALAQALYRPWALVTLDETQFRRVDQYGSLSPNSARDYTRILLKLEDWSLGGLSQYRAMSAYRDQLAATVDVVAHFYVVNFQWPPMDIDLNALAVHALTTAIAQGFGFYMYEPFASDSERRLRRAILDHKPLSEIETIEADLGAMGNGQRGGESLLNIAVTYPDAVRYLLAHGVDPNQTNGFGKTPLMYAAQYNQAESVALLLDAGADPNAGTVWPQNNCYYALQTANMTPLHYAVRYASAGLVRALLSHGAKTYLKTEKLPYLGKAGEYPVDWFRKYTALDSKEPNPNIPPSEVPALEALLALPNAAGRAAIVGLLVRDAEDAGARGDTSNALRLLKEALSVQPDDERVHRAVLQIGLKAEPGFVLKTAEAAISANRSPASVAAALFDQGLACEQAGAGIVIYENRSYCFEPAISLFFRSYQTAPSEAARAKLLSLFNGGVKSCTVTVDAVPAKYHVAGAYLYILHPSSFKIDPKSIEYRDSRTGETGHPRVNGSINLADGQSVTSLWYRDYNRQSVVIGGRPCAN